MHLDRYCKMITACITDRNFIAFRKRITVLIDHVRGDFDLGFVYLNTLKDLRKLKSAMFNHLTKFETFWSWTFEPDEGCPPLVIHITILVGFNIFDPCIVITNFNFYFDDISN